MTLLSSAFLPRTRRASGFVARQQELTAESLWTEVSGRLKGALNDTTYGTWFGDVSSRELTDEAFVLSVPNDFTREWIEGHFLDLIGAAVRDAGGTERQIQLSVEQEVEPLLVAGVDLLSRAMLLRAADVEMVELEGLGLLEDPGCLADLLGD